MQTSKITIGKEYAVRRENKLHAMYVHSITTTRAIGRSGKDDVTNLINGTIAGDDSDERVTVSYKPEDVLGPFEDYVEMVNERKAKEAEKEAAIQKLKFDADDLIRKLYLLSGQAIPNKPESYRDPFSPMYTGSINIDPEGVKLLMKILQNNKPIA